MNDPEPRELALSLDSKWALLKPNLASERNDPLCTSSWDAPWLLPGLRDSLSCPGRWGVGFLSSPTLDLDHVSQLSAACQHCSPSCPAAASRPARSPFNKAAVFSQTDRAGEGPGPLQRGRLPCLCHRGCRFPTPDLQPLFPVTQHFVAGPGEDRCQGSQRQNT